MVPVDRHDIAGSLNAAGRRRPGAVVERTYRELLGLGEEELAAPHTVPREIRVTAASAFDPDQAARITVPTLLLIGADTSKASLASLGVETVAAAQPDARVVFLDGQDHHADLLVPELVANELLTFLSELPGFLSGPPPGRCVTTPDNPDPQGSVGLLMRDP